MRYGQGMMKKQVVAWLVLCCAIAQPIQAETPPPSQSLRGAWQFDFIGIPFARLWLAIDETPAEYELTASFKSKGIVSLFKKMDTLTQSQGVMTEAGMRARMFRYENTAEGKYTHVTLDDANALVKREVVPEDDPWHREPVPAARVKGAYLPGDVFFALRTKWDSLREGKTASITFYDGKRLSRIQVRPIQPESIMHHQRSVATLRVALSRELLAGYSQKEKDRFAMGDPPVFVWLREQDGFPIRLEAQLGYGVLRGVWLAE